MKRYISLLLILSSCSIWNCGGTTPEQESGLYVHLTFDTLTDNDSITPDSSGNGHNGKTNGQILVDGVIGKALEFGGLDQIVDMGDLSLSVPCTIAFWFKTSDLFHDRRLFSQLEGAETQAGALRLDGARLEIWDGAEWAVLVDRLMKINKWMHVAVVFGPDGKTSGYLNGARQHLVSCSTDFNGVHAAIGGKFLNEQGNVFTGSMDDFRIYSRALDAEEIAEIHTASVQ